MKLRFPLHSLLRHPVHLQPPPNPWLLVPPFHFDVGHRQTPNVNDKLIQRLTPRRSTQPIDRITHSSVSHSRYPNPQATAFLIFHEVAFGKFVACCSSHHVFPCRMFAVVSSVHHESTWAPGTHPLGDHNNHFRSRRVAAVQLFCCLLLCPVTDTSHLHRR